jgi:predicted dehydrogenase
MKKIRWNRREFLKAGGMMAFAAPLARLRPPRGKAEVFMAHAQTPSYSKPGRPVTAIVLGAGNRGNVYASYSQNYPDELKIVGVAEPIEFRRRRFAELYEIPASAQWVTWEHALEVPKFADALIITTPDNLHYGPAMKGLEMGCDLLLEKAIAQSWKECSDILELTKKQGRIVGICHVLRYTPYFRKLKAVVDSGVLGELVSVQHFEPVEHIHMSHSFVRGNWRNSKESNPMLLSKSCHDLDILRWIIGKPCQRISSFGALTLFKAENAPPGSALRCTDGCRAEPDCPYSALKIYVQRKTYLGHLLIEDQRDETILEALRIGPYGRCVYHCDNDVVDHQVVAMEFEGRVTAAFSMEAFTSYAGRRTRLMGTKGDAQGDMTILSVHEFRTGTQTDWDARQDPESQSGHGGGDYGLVRDFIQAISRQEASLLTSTLEASMESHLMAFRAEESRLTGQTVEVSPA